MLVSVTIVVYNFPKVAITTIIVVNYSNGLCNEKKRRDL